MEVSYESHTAERAVFCGSGLIARTSSLGRIRFPLPVRQFLTLVRKGAGFGLGSRFVLGVMTALVKGLSVHGVAGAARNDVASGWGICINRGIRLGKAARYPSPPLSMGAALRKGGRHLNHIVVGQSKSAGPRPSRGGGTECPTLSSHGTNPEIETYDTPNGDVCVSPANTRLSQQ